MTDDDDEADDDIVSPELLAAVERLDRDEYDVPRSWRRRTWTWSRWFDFLAETRKFEPKNDDKLQS